MFVINSIRFAWSSYQIRRQEKEAIREAAKAAEVARSAGTIWAAVQMTANVIKKDGKAKLEEAQKEAQREKIQSNKALNEHAHTVKKVCGAIKKIPTFGYWMLSKKALFGVANGVQKMEESKDTTCFGKLKKRMGFASGAIHGLCSADKVEVEALQKEIDSPLKQKLDWLYRQVRLDEMRGTNDLVKFIYQKLMEVVQPAIEKGIMDETRGPIGSVLYNLMEISMREIPKIFSNLSMKDRMKLFALAKKVLEQIAQSAYILSQEEKISKAVVAQEVRKLVGLLYSDHSSISLPASLRALLPTNPEDVVNIITDKLSDVVIEGLAEAVQYITDDPVHREKLQTWLQDSLNVIGKEMCITVSVMVNGLLQTSLPCMGSTVGQLLGGAKGQWCASSLIKCATGSKIQAYILDKFLLQKQIDRRERRKKVHETQKKVGFLMKKVVAPALAQRIAIKLIPENRLKIREHIQTGVKLGIDSFLGASAAHKCKTIEPVLSFIEQNITLPSEPTIPALFQRPID